MSAKNHRLVEFYKEQGGQDDDAERQGDKTSWIDPEQMRRAEGRMAGAPGTTGSGVSDVADPAASPSEEPTQRRQRRKSDGG